MINVVLSVLIYGTQIVAGLLVVRGLRDDNPASTWNRGPGKWARVLLFGPGALTLQMLLYDSVGLRFDLLTILAPWWALGAWTWWRREPRRPVPPEPWMPLAVIAVVAVVAVSYPPTGFVPIHHGDAIHNFSVVGKLFAQREGLAPRALVGIVDPGHNEYPPLVALNEALFFMVNERLAPWAIRPFFGMAHLALGLLTIEAVWNARAPRVVTLLALVFVCSPQLCANSGTGTPDVRLAATVLLLGLQFLTLHHDPGRGLLRFAAVAGLCGFTKNEGIAISYLSFGYLAFHALRFRVDLRSALAAMLFVLSLVSTWPVYRSTHGIREQFTADAVTNLDLGLAIGRVPEVLHYFSHLMVAPLPEGPPRWGVFWFVALACTLLGLARPASRRATIGLLVAFGLHIGLYTATFAATGYGLQWHLMTAADRLLVHTSGWAVLLIGVGVAGAYEPTSSAAEGDPDRAPRGVTA